jgi:hypothetical protein
MNVGCIYTGVTEPRDAVLHSMINKRCNDCVIYYECM